MFELGEFIGKGGSSAFFRIRGQPELGVKISITLTGERAKLKLEEELEKAKTLAQLKISIPNYVEVVQIMVPEYYVKTLDRGIKRNITMPPQLSTDNLKKEIIEKLSEPMVFGLVMEYVESDLKLVNARRLDYLWRKELIQIQSYGIIVGQDSFSNILYSKRTGKIYFIDFDYWDLSNLHDPNKKVSWFRKIFT